MLLQGVKLVLLNVAECVCVGACFFIPSWVASPSTPDADLIEPIYLFPSFFSKLMAPSCFLVLVAAVNPGSSCCEWNVSSAALSELISPPSPSRLESG